MSLHIGQAQKLSGWIYTEVHVYTQVVTYMTHTVA